MFLEAIGSEEFFLCFIALAEFVITIEMFREDFVDAMAQEIHAAVSTDAQIIVNPNDAMFYIHSGGARPAMSA